MSEQKKRVSRYELLLQAKDSEIQRLIGEKNELIEKLLKHAFPIKPTVEPKRPMIFDEKTKTVREKTPQEISEEFNSLKSLGIL